MSVRIAEVLEQDGETWVKSGDPLDPPGWYVAVRVDDIGALWAGERLRLPCGAVLQVVSWFREWHGCVDLLSPGPGRPPRLEPGMLLEVDTGGVCAGSVASCEGEPGTLEQKFLRALLRQQRIWVARHFLCWCKPEWPRAEMVSLEAIDGALQRQGAGVAPRQRGADGDRLATDPGVGLGSSAGLGGAGLPRRS